MTRHDRSRLALIGWIALFVVGCSPAIIPDTPSGSTPVTEAPAIMISPTAGDATPMNSPLPTANAGLQSLIENTKADLAERLSISAAQINLIEAMEVEWSDSSLGCPQPGMDYLQVITPGYLIRLEANAQTYEYHSNRDTYFVLCENSSPPGIPKP